MRLRRGCTGNMLHERRRLMEMVQNIKEGIQGHAASWYSDIFDLVFPDLDHDLANNMWKKQLKEPKKRKEQDDDSSDDNDD